MYSVFGTQPHVWAGTHRVPHARLTHDTPMPSMSLWVECWAGGWPYPHRGCVVCTRRRGHTGCAGAAVLVRPCGAGLSTYNSVANTHWRRSRTRAHRQLLPACAPRRGGCHTVVAFVSGCPSLPCPRLPNAAQQTTAANTRCGRGLLPCSPHHTPVTGTRYPAHTFVFMRV